MSTGNRIADQVLTPSEQKEYTEWLERMDKEKDGEDESYAEVQAAMDRDNKSYQAQWPRLCQPCKGWGVHTWKENQSPLGSGLYWPEAMSDPCAHCTEKGLCARCGEPGLTSEDRGDATTGEGPCKFCGWNYETGLQDWSH
jgi:hypothetical protein